jgi:hypothetical protein
MVDNSRRVDLSGNDLVVNSIAISSGVNQGGQAGRVIDLNTTAPVAFSGTSGTATLANLASGMLLSTNAAATTITLDTATNIVAALNAAPYCGANVGDMVSFDVSSHGAGGATLAVGTGGTLANGSTGTVATGTQKTFLLQMTNVTTAPAYTVNA